MSEKKSEEKIDRRNFIKGSALLGLTALLSGCDSDETLIKRHSDQKALLMDNSLCIECQACRVACQNEHEIDVEYSFIKFINQEKGEYPNVEYNLRRNSCMHCPDAPCVSVCPVDALYFGEGEFTALDVEECIACGQCLTACPFDVPEIGEERMYKCNGCQHLIAEDGIPACVNTCIAYALDFGDFDDMVEKGKERVEALKEDHPDANLYAAQDFGLLLILKTKPEELDLA